MEAGLLLQLQVLVSTIELALREEKVIPVRVKGVLDAIIKVYLC